MLVAPLSSTSPVSIVSSNTLFRPFTDHSTLLSPQLQRARQRRCSCVNEYVVKQTCQTQPKQHYVPPQDRLSSKGYAPGPAEAPPSYASIDSSPWNKAIMALFRHKMVVALAEDTDAQG